MKKSWFNLKEVSAKALVEGTAVQSLCDSLLGCPLYIFNGKPSFNIGVFSILALESSVFVLTSLIQGNVLALLICQSSVCLSRMGEAQSHRQDA